MCMCVYVYVCVYICIYIYVYVYVFSYVYIYVYIYMYIYVYIYTYTYVPMTGKILNNTHTQSWLVNGMVYIWHWRNTTVLGTGCIASAMRAIMIPIQNPIYVKYNNIYI